MTLADGTRRDPFAEYHASKTRQYIDRTMASGQDIFDVMQACIILSWYFYQEGRWVEVWIFAGFQTRVAIPLRLNYPGTFTTQGSASPGAYLAPPKDTKDLECRRRAWWMTMLFDRIVAVVGHSGVVALPPSEKGFLSGWLVTQRRRKGHRHRVPTADRRLHQWGGWSINARPKTAN